jgi:superfamily I DNA/RNA helicase
MVDFNFNIQIQAVAGSGKTFTLTEFAKKLPADQASVAVAFNKNIADDFSQRFPSNVQCSTLHSLGNSLIKQNLRRSVVNERKVENIFKYKVLGFDSKSKKFPNKTDQVYFWDWRKEVSKLVSIFKGYGLTDSTDIPKLIAGVGELYQIDLPELPIVQEVYDLSLDQTGVIDFDDMILFPLVNRYEFPHFKNIFLDEAQDMNPCQQKFIQRLANTQGRVVVAGDTFQAIYAFRGASPESMLEFKILFNPTELPLSICYRCSKAVVKEAHNLVRQIEAWDNAIEGIVDSILPSKMNSIISDGDFILCRFNAPLVHHYLELKSLGRNVKIRGAKIVQSLVDMVEDVKKKFSSCNLSTISQYISYIEGRETMKKNKKLYLLNLLEILSAFLKEQPDTDKLRETIIKAFSDSTEGIILSTIHGVKGLEAKRVFLVAPELLPSPRASQPWEIQQETNLKYVAITRAKEEFYYVNNS